MSKRSVQLKVLAAAALAVFAAPAFAQASAGASTTGTTRIVTPISITKNTDLAFGTIVRSTSGGANTVTINEGTGARTISGAGTGVLATSSSGRATYTVNGEGGQTFSISTPATFNMTSGGNTLTVNLVASSATGSLSNSIGTAGTATFGVGGNMSVAQGQASGNYTGSFTATVAYN